MKEQMFFSPAYLKIFAVVVIIIAIYSGVRFIGTTIHYGCTREPVYRGEIAEDDCPPPFYLVGQLGFYLTGGSLVPLWNRDAVTVDTVSWNIEKANPAITSEDDFRFYEQKVAADVTFFDGSTKRYDLGTAYGCTGNTRTEIVPERKLIRGSVDCYYALTGTTFVAFLQNDRFHIERYDESAKDGSIKTSALVEI